MQSWNPSVGLKYQVFKDFLVELITAVTGVPGFEPVIDQALTYYLEPQSDDVDNIKYTDFFTNEHVHEYFQENSFLNTQSYQRLTEITTNTDFIEVFKTYGEGRRNCLPFFRYFTKQSIDYHLEKADDAAQASSTQLKRYIYNLEHRLIDVTSQLNSLTRYIVEVLGPNLNKLTRQV